MKKLVFLFCILMGTATYANNLALNESLLSVINQINAMMPLLDEAQGEINPTERIQLNINGFTDAEGQYHPGVREDLLMIRDGLIDYINTPVITPRKVAPLSLDFVSVRND